MQNNNKKQNLIREAFRKQAVRRELKVKSTFDFAACGKSQGGRRKMRVAGLVKGSAKCPDERRCRESE